MSSVDGVAYMDWGFVVPTLYAAAALMEAVPNNDHAVMTCSEQTPATMHIHIVSNLFSTSFYYALLQEYVYDARERVPTHLAYPQHQR